MWIVRLALRRPYTFVVLALLIAVLGVGQPSTPELVGIDDSANRWCRQERVAKRIVGGKRIREPENRRACQRAMTLRRCIVSRAAIQLRRFFAS